MSTRWLLACSFAVCLALGCGSSKEIAPTTDAGTKLSEQELQEQYRKNMEKAKQFASPQMKAQMERFSKQQSEAPK